MDAWEEEQEQGLEDAPRCGAPRRFTPEEEERILELMTKHPHQPKQVKAAIHSETGKELTDDILRRLAAENNFT